MRFSFPYVKHKPQQSPSEQKMKLKPSNTSQYEIKQKSNVSYDYDIVIFLKTLHDTVKEFNHLDK